MKKKVALTLENLLICKTKSTRTTEAQLTKIQNPPPILGILTPATIRKASLSNSRWQTVKNVQIYPQTTDRWSES